MRRLVLVLGSASDAEDVAQEAYLLASREAEARLTEPGWVERGQARHLLMRLLPDRLERFLIRCGLILSVLGALLGLILVIAVSSNQLAFVPEPSGPIEFPTEPVWVLLLAGVWIVVGAANTIASVLSFLGRHARAMTVAMYATLISLVAGGLLNTYVSQLGALSGVVIQLGLLLLILDQRQRLSEAANAPVP